MTENAHPPRRIAAALLLVAACLVGVAVVYPVAAQDTSLTQLRLDVQNLAYRLDLENRQLRGEVDRLELRLRELENQRFSDSVGPAPVPPSPAMAAAPRSRVGDEIVARRFVVEDAEGRIRAVLGMSDIHGPMLALLDEAGEIGSMTRIGEPEDLDAER